MTAEQWHVPSSMLSAYVAGRVADADAWSVEAHVVSCAQCRTSTATLVAASPVAPDLRRIQDGLRTSLPAQGHVRRGTPARRARVLALSGAAVPWGWLVSVVVLVALAYVLDRQGVGLGDQGADGTSGASWVLLLAPIIPVLAVAAATGAGRDPTHELVTVSAAGGLQVLLWRTAAALTATFPALLVGGAATRGPGPVVWLLPATALVGLTLALSSFVGTGPAAGIVTLAWVLLVGGPALVDGVPLLIEDGSPPPADALAWATILAISVSVVHLRRHSWNLLGQRKVPS